MFNARGKSGGGERLGPVSLRGGEGGRDRSVGEKGVVGGDEVGVAGAGEIFGGHRRKGFAWTKVFAKLK